LASAARPARRGRARAHRARRSRAVLPGDPEAPSLPRAQALRGHRCERSNPGRLRGGLAMTRLTPKAADLIHRHVGSQSSATKHAQMRARLVEATRPRARRARTAMIALSAVAGVIGACVF